MADMTLHDADFIAEYCSAMRVEYSYDQERDAMRVAPGHGFVAYVHTIPQFSLTVTTMIENSMIEVLS